MEALLRAWEETTPGRKRTVSLMDEGMAFPMTLIAGTRPGKTVLLTAGIHGCEYCSIQAASELAAQWTPEQVSGRVAIVHVANMSGFWERLPAIAAEDGKNLNRVFPGNSAGTHSEKLAYGISELQARSDFYIDMHGGDLHESLHPFVFIPGRAEPRVTEAAREAAGVLAVDTRVLSSATTGAYNSAAVRGVPSLLIERGGNGVWSREEVDAYKRDIIAVLHHLGVLRGETDAAREGNGAGARQRETVAAYLEADGEGCWYPAVKPGEHVRQGAALGELRDVFGKTEKVHYAQCDGTVLYMTVSLAVKAGTPLVAYG